MFPSLKRPVGDRLAGLTKPGSAGASARRGSLGAASAIAVVVVVGALGLAADPAASQGEERRGRVAVQDGALAGAAALREGGDAVEAAMQILARSGMTRSGEPRRDSVEINRPPQSGAYAGQADAVEVVLVRLPAIGMAHVALGSTQPMRIRAVALAATERACPPPAELSACLQPGARAVTPAPRLVE